MNQMMFQERHGSFSLVRVGYPHRQHGAPVVGASPAADDPELWSVVSPSHSVGARGRWSFQTTCNGGKLGRGSEPRGSQPMADSQPGFPCPDSLPRAEDRQGARMSQSGRSGSPASAAVSTGSVDSFLETKSHQPPTHGDLVDRARLLDRVEDEVAYPSCGGGPGYLPVRKDARWSAQWLNRRPSPHATAWVSLDAGDNDRSRSGRMWPGTRASQLPPGPERCRPRVQAQQRDHHRAPPGLLDAMAAMPEEIIILLDDFQVVHEQACETRWKFLIDHFLPPALSRAGLALRSRPAARPASSERTPRGDPVPQISRSTPRRRTALLALEGVPVVRRQCPGF